MQPAAAHLLPLNPNAGQVTARPRCPVKEVRVQHQRLDLPRLRQHGAKPPCYQTPVSSVPASRQSHCIHAQCSPPPLRTLKASNMCSRSASSFQRYPIASMLRFRRSVMYSGSCGSQGRRTARSGQWAPARGSRRITSLLGVDWADWHRPERSARTSQVPTLLPGKSATLLMRFWIVSAVRFAAALGWGVWGWGRLLGGEQAPSPVHNTA